LKGIELTFETVPDGSGDHPDCVEVVRSPAESGLSFYWLSATKIKKIRKLLNTLLSREVTNAYDIAKIIVVIEDTL
jgi:hypothetical protein